MFTDTPETQSKANIRSFGFPLCFTFMLPACSSLVYHRNMRRQVEAAGPHMEFKAFKPHGLLMPTRSQLIKCWRNNFSAVLKRAGKIRESKGPCHHLGCLSISDSNNHHLCCHMILFFISERCGKACRLSCTCSISWKNAHTCS